MALRVNLAMEDRIPADHLVIYGRGALLNGNQNLVTTFTVHPTHDFEVGHKFLYALTRTNILTNRVFTVTAKTGTTIQFNGAATSGVDKAWLIPLGVESGGVLQDDGTFSQLNYDGSTVAVYQDPNADDLFVNSEVPVDPGGEAGWWQLVSEVWAVAIARSGKPVRAYALVAAQPSVGGEGGIAGRGSELPGTGDPDNPFFIVEPDPIGEYGSILYAWMKQVDEDYAWQFITGIL